MKLKLKRISPLQAGKLLAAFYGLFSLLIVPFLLIAMAAGSFAAKAQGAGAAPPTAWLFGMGFGFILMIPVMYAVMGFVCGVLSALLYNLLARWIGGLELEFDPASPPLPAPASLQP